MSEVRATVGDFIRSQAKHHGDRELIVAGDTRATYGEIEARAAGLARGLLARGVGKGTRVAVLLPNGADWVVAWLAAARIGALVVPLNTFFQVRELAWILKHADIDTLLTQSEILSQDMLSRLEAAAPGLADRGAGPLRLPALPYLRSVLVYGACDRAWAVDATGIESDAGDAAGIDGDFLAAVEAEVSPADPMVMLYSSGSTADPKGAIHSHGSTLRHAERLAGRRDLAADERIWSPMPFFWVGGFVFALLSTLRAGACMLVEERFDPERTLAFLERERATIAIGWPHFGKALAEHPSRTQRDLSALRAGNVPDILPPEVAPADPELRPNALGMTETCGPHTWSQEGRLPEALRGTFGRAVEGVEHRIVDPESGAVLSAGEAGEICVRGQTLMLRLYKHEREQTFDADGFYHTGDGGYFDRDGLLHFTGRLGDMIKTGGANVTPSEVEGVLSGLPEVKDAYVVGVPDPERGQNVAAAVVLEAGASVSVEALRARLKREISAYKVPRHWLLAAQTELPFTDSGKLDRRQLSLRLAERIERGEI